MHDKYNRARWSEVFDVPTVKECEEFMRKADDFLRSRGQYVGKMRPRKFVFGKLERENNRNENIVESS